MSHSVHLLSLSAIVGAMCIACAPAPPSAGHPKQVQLTVTASEFKLSPSVQQIPAGHPVALNFKNEGMIEHNVHVEGTSTHLAAGPGKTVSGDVTLDTPGEYTFVCTIPGHQQAGMQMQVRVVAAEAAPAAAPTNVASQVQRTLSGITPLAQPVVAPPVGQRAPTEVHFDLETRQVVGMLADGVPYTFWTFNGSVPGPMIRVRQGDTVELTLRNATGAGVTHSINIHAAHAPGGGSVDTQVAPGGESTIRFQALNPGVYVYHCMTPPVDQHVANGMYGLVIVEPPEGLPRVDREWYVMQGDFYVRPRSSRQAEPPSRSSACRSRATT
jgi:nitrite reductase (NO-forming)